MKLSCLSFAQNFPAAPHFAQGISHGPYNGSWGPPWYGLHVTSLNSPTHLPFAFFGPLTVPLTNKKPCSCPKAYCMSSQLCLKIEKWLIPSPQILTPVLLSWWGLLWKLYFKLQINPSSTLNPPYPNIFVASFDFLHSSPHLLCFLSLSSFVCSFQRLGFLRYLILLYIPQIWNSIWQTVGIK